MGKSDRERAEELLSELFPAGETKHVKHDALTPEEEERDLKQERMSMMTKELMDLVAQMFKESTGLEPMTLHWFKNGLGLRRGNSGPWLFMIPPELGALIAEARRFADEVNRSQDFFEQLPVFDPESPPE